MRLIHRALCVIFLLILLVHAVGIFLPETGFDALWYHLPIVRDMAQTHQMRVTPAIPQSNQPRLGELIFLPWLLLFGITGVKVCTFLLTLVLLSLVHRVALTYVGKTYALLTTILIATFHTIAWQATSAYVDVLRTLFEIGIFLFLSRRAKHRYETVALAFLIVGAILTKLVTLLFVPSLLLFIALKRSIRTSLFLCAVVLSVVFIVHMPLSFFTTTGKALVTESTLFGSLRSFILLPLELSFHTESYTAPLFLFIVPFFMLQLRWLWGKYRSEVIFLAMSFLTWVFVIPISVRYDLSTIILATILSIVVFVHWAKKRLYFHFIFSLFLLVTILLNMLPRVGAIVRALPFLLGRETQEQYLCRFDRGITRGPLEMWYGVLPCHAVQ